MTQAAILAKTTKSTPAPILYMVIGGKRYPVPSLEEASRRYAFVRDRCGEGASTISSAPILDAAGNQVAYISYNGKVWAGRAEEWVAFSGKAPIYDPFAARASEASPS